MVNKPQIVSYDSSLCHEFRYTGSILFSYATEIRLYFLFLVIFHTYTCTCICAWHVGTFRHIFDDFPFDCFQGHVVMGTQAVSPYQQVIEKTKGLAFKSPMLVMNIEKKLGQQKEVREQFHVSSMILQH